MTELAARNGYGRRPRRWRSGDWRSFGLVKRSRDPSDMRAVLVEVTPEGLVQHGEALATRRAYLAAMLTRLSEDERLVPGARRLSG